MKHKKCRMCSSEYDFELIKCPKCGSHSYIIGYGAPSAINYAAPKKTSADDANSNIVADIVGVVADVAVACASTAGDVISNTFDSVSNIDFGGGGAGDLFD